MFARSQLSSSTKPTTTSIASMQSLIRRRSIPLVEEDQYDGACNVQANTSTMNHLFAQPFRTRSLCSTLDHWHIFRQKFCSELTIFFPGRTRDHADESFNRRGRPLKADKVNSSYIVTPRFGWREDRTEKRQDMKKYED